MFVELRPEYSIFITDVAKVRPAGCMRPFGLFLRPLNLSYPQKQIIFYPIFLYISSQQASKMTKYGKIVCKNLLLAEVVTLNSVIMNFLARSEI